MAKQKGWLCWIGPAQRPVIHMREIKRGKNKGKLEVTLPVYTKAMNGRVSKRSAKLGKKVIIKKSAVIKEI